MKEEKIKKEKQKGKFEEKKEIKEKVEKIEIKKKEENEIETEKKAKKEEKPKREKELKEYDIIIHPLISEKAVNLIEAENSITFIVNQKANKVDIKNLIESLYKVEVDKVRIIRDMKGRKKAIVKINKKFKAGDIATKLGVL